MGNRAGREQSSSGRRGRTYSLNHHAPFLLAHALLVKGTVTNNCHAPQPRARLGSRTSTVYPGATTNCAG
ncbi:hypothetical protein AB0I84_24185 [Streptomyces spectabilis]|uniref:hypothetical protein n=1 Tax=Streptomyces spectabilis TaxID=68270 RepID=UPI0033EAC335